MSATDIITRYCASLDTQLIELAEILKNAAEGVTSITSALVTLHGELHRMGGAALCMGYSHFGNRIKSFERDVEATILSEIEPERELLGIYFEEIATIARLAEHVQPKNSLLLRQKKLESQSALKPAVNMIRTAQKDVLQSQRVLFADDDASIRDLMQDILVSLQVEAVATACDGEELLNKAPDFSPTIIITDWHMLPCDGMQVLSRIRSGEAGIDKQTPVIFLTSERTLSEVQHVISSGADQFLVKPFSMRTVERVLKDAGVQSIGSYAHG
ncbi:response regulator [Ponticaulis sp.]|uniref:response regulator n=1 Tax=Ponticaulis sp. TaxID=2020902 RepID=UPI000B6F5410|nr:response regulator [Ponticaulis sp.]MAI89134.1 hypothetical protein [Ponticaulis sp.]OUY01133.1 MAG: hypothetical protein CBB65_01450 [Hyphomonadaceae bacterium TMED5]|tara:strand:- start:134429 stop:135244 length:816 start_codon:yes stop_codon:yes gene_type:complete